MNTVAVWVKRAACDWTQIPHCVWKGAKRVAILMIAYWNCWWTSWMEDWMDVVLCHVETVWEQAVANTDILLVKVVILVKVPVLVKVTGP